MKSTLILILFSFLLASSLLAYKVHLEQERLDEGQAELTELVQQAEETYNFALANLEKAKHINEASIKAFQKARELLRTAEALLRDAKYQIHKFEQKRKRRS